MKIYVPNTEEIKNKIKNDIKNDNFLIYSEHDFTFWKEISEYEFNTLEICSLEHMMCNLLIFDDQTTFILDGIGYVRVNLQKFL